MIASLCWGIASGVGIIIGGMLGRNELEEAKKAGGSFVRFYAFFQQFFFYCLI